MKSTALSKNRHCEGRCVFENHWSKVDNELNSDFQLLHRYFFLKYSSEIFLISYCFQEKILECFKAYVSVSNPILLKLGSSNVSPKNIFLEICRSFGITSKELVLENYALEYQTADKGHIDIL